MSTASNVLLIVLVIVAARVLGDKSFGQFSVALALTSIFEMVVDLGLNTFTARNVSRDRALAGVYLPNILGWKLILSAAAAGLLALSVKVLHLAPDARAATYILGGAVILRSYKLTSQAFFQAYERFDLIMLTTYVERIAVLVVGVIVLLLTRSLIMFAATFAVVRIPDLVFAYWLVHRQIASVRIGLDLRIVKNVQVSAVPFGAYAIALATYWYVGTVVLSAMRPPAEVGWYNAGYKIYESLTMFPFILSAVLLPRLSRLFTMDRSRHATLSLRALRYLSLGSLPLAISIGILAPQIVMLLYGQAYLHAVPALRVLLGASVLMFINWTVNMVLISADREKAVLKVMATGLLVMITANLALVSRLGMMGAAYSVAVSEMCVFALLLGTMRRALFSIPAHAIAWRPALACAAAGGVLLLLRVTLPIASVLLFVAAYAVVLVALRTFDAEEWSAVKSLFSPYAVPRK